MILEMKSMLWLDPLIIPTIEMMGQVTEVALLIAIIVVTKSVAGEIIEVATDIKENLVGH